PRGCRKCFAGSASLPAWDALLKRRCCWRLRARKAALQTRLRPRHLQRQHRQKVPCPFMQRIDFNGLYSAIHGPIRLGIMTSLQMDGALDFTTLKKRLDVPDGSLNLHLKTLQQ